MVASGKLTIEFPMDHQFVHWQINYFDWAMFSSYVQLPEGISVYHITRTIMFTIHLTLTIISYKQFAVYNHYHMTLININDIIEAIPTEHRPASCAMVTRAVTWARAS